MELGGQAVIEGVMMRSNEKFAVAIRTKDDKIKVKKEKNSTFPKVFKKPFIRGIVGLGYTLYDGYRALIWSSNQQLEKEEKFTKKEVVGTVLLSLLIAVGFFVVVPFFAARFIHSEGFLFDVLDGIIRVVIFLGYLTIISLMKDVKTLFQYHGAEHKTISCYEAKEKLTINNVMKHTRFNPRCGTSFLFFVIILSIIVFTLIRGPLWTKLLGRIILLPVIAAVSYELIKLSSKFKKSCFVKHLVAPGMWLQKITTREPNKKQVEVAIKALRGVLK